MSEDVKTQVDYFRDVVSQLKEMKHYAQNNTETLSAQWLAFDAGEYKHPQFAESINKLLNEQGQLLENIDTVIQDIEIEINHQEQES